MLRKALPRMGEPSDVMIVQGIAQSHQIELPTGKRQDVAMRPKGGGDVCSYVIEMRLELRCLIHDCTTIASAGEEPAIEAERDGVYVSETREQAFLDLSSGKIPNKNAVAIVTLEAGRQ
jgi:hypothetical protein